MMALLRKALPYRVPYLSSCISGGVYWAVGGRTEGHCVRLLSTSGPLRLEEKETHTGQKWDKDDYRRVRFIGKEKLVNEQFAIDLVAEEPVACVNGTHVWCDGGRGALGHPRVYINLDRPEINDCGYCGRRFIADKHKTLFSDEKYVDL